MTDSSLDNVVVVGGGTAGWLTALYAKRRLPDSTVTLVESESLGILGAGEGTTPAFLEFLDLLGIPFSRLVREADSTVKHGIKFSNWGEHGTDYYHGFFSSTEVAFNAFDSPLVLHKSNVLLPYLQKSWIALNDVNFPKLVSDEGKVALYQYEDYAGQFVADPIHKYEGKNYFSAHINAVKLADLLKKIAVEERGIVRIEGFVSDYKQNDSGDIEQIILSDGQVLNSDIVFDCTGFRGVFSKEVYSSPWISFSDHLTVDSAQTFFLPIDKDEAIPPQTESIALSFGWAWKIPLQTRYGCGYVYDSSYASEEEAVEEIKAYFGEEVEIGRKIEFSPGYLEKPWNGNCIAIGLSSGFIEPLEATSIWTSILAIREAFSDLRVLAERPEEAVSKFNKYMAGINEQIFSFVYLHYICGREDNSFWKHYTVDNGPDSLKDFLGYLETNILSYTDFSNTLFPLESWMCVLEGLGLLNADLYTKTYERNLSSFGLDNFYENLKNIQKDTVAKCILHREFLEDLK